MNYILKVSHNRIRRKPSAVIARKTWQILYTGILLFSVTAFFQTAVAQEDELPVIPLPREVSVADESLDGIPSEAGIRLYADRKEQHAMAMQQLAGACEQRFGTRPAVGETGPASIKLGIPAEDKSFRKLCTDAGIWPEDRWGEEGYTLLVNPDEIIIAAASAAGVFYGVQSLKMIFRGIHPGAPVPCVRITDWPTLPLRAIMDDISRGPVPTMEFAKQQIRRFAELKYNAMSFYIEHVVKTEKHPDFAPETGGITIEEFAELSAYAADYHMELIGSFQSLGHFEKILAFPQYAHLGETNRMLSPVDPEAKQFLKDIYSEMAPAFSSQIFRIDCDEAWDLGRGASGAYAESMGGVARIYADHVNELAAYLATLGKKTLIWDDIARAHPDIFNLLDKENMIMGTWDYSARESFADFIDPVKNAGFEFIVTPGVLNSNRLFPDYKMTFHNIRSFVNEGVEKGASGMMLTAWDDGGFHFFSHDWLGVAYAAEQSWHPNQGIFERFDSRFNLAVYGDQSENITRSVRMINELADLQPTYEMNDQVMWKTLVPETGSLQKVSLQYWPEIIQISNYSLDALNRADPEVYGNDLDYIRFTVRQYLTLGTSRQALLEASEEYRQALYVQVDNRTEARTRLEKALRTISGVKADWIMLKDDFERLWLQENRTHWLENPMRRYGVIIRDIEEARFNIQEGMARLERGSYLVTPAEARLDIVGTSGQYFTFWLLSGVFPNDDKFGRKPDYLVNAGGEPGIRPTPGMTFIATNGKEYRFSKYNSPLFDRVDLTDCFEENQKVFAYAYCRIESPVGQTVTAAIGSNDGLEVFLNGERVHEIHESRDLIPDEDKIEFKLNKGYNHVLLKVENWKYAWEFSFRLLDVEVRNHKQKYEILE